MIMKKIALLILITFLGNHAPCHAVFIGAHAYKKEFPDGTHYVVCLGDMHVKTPCETQQLNDLHTLILHNAKNTMLIYEGYGPNISRLGLRLTRPTATLLRRLDLLCDKENKNIESFNAEWRPTPSDDTPTEHIQMFLDAFDATEREINTYGGPKEMKALYRACIEREHKNKEKIKKAIDSAPRGFLDSELSIRLGACLGDSFIDARFARKIYEHSKKKSLIIVCAGLAHIDNRSTLSTLLDSIGYTRCFTQGVVHVGDLANLPQLTWLDIGSLVVRNCLCCSCLSDSLSEQIETKREQHAALDIEQTFAQFFQHEEQQKSETEAAPLLAQVTQQETASEIRKR